MRWGPTPGGALPAAAGAGHGAGARRPPTDDPSYLSTEAARRLAAGRRPLRAVHPALRRRQRRPRSRTPRSSGRSASLPPSRSPCSPSPRGDVSTVDALAQARIIDTLAFNPWNTTDEFRPLGNLNRARKAVYDAELGAPAGLPLADRSRRCATRCSARRARTAFSVVNRYVPWYRLPGPLSACSTSRPSGTCCASRT